MADEKEKNGKFKSGLAIWSDLFNILGLPLMGVAWYCIQTSITLNRTQSESAAKDTYVQKVEFLASIAAVKDSQVKLWEKQNQAGDFATAKFNEIYLSLQHINDTANVIKAQTK